MYVNLLQSHQQSGNAEADEKVTVLNTRITEMLEQIEKLGSEGEVEQAQSLMKLCDQLKEEREQLQNSKGGVRVRTFNYNISIIQLLICNQTRLRGHFYFSTLRPKAQGQRCGK